MSRSELQAAAITGASRPRRVFAEHTWLRRHTGDADLGFIAEEMAEVLPEIVNFDNGRPTGIDYGRVTALLVEAGLVDGAQHVAHAVGLHPQRHVDSRLRHVLEIVGAIEPGGAVQGSPGRLNAPEMLALGHVLRSLEEQMLEEVREPGALARLNPEAAVVWFSC